MFRLSLLLVVVSLSTLLHSSTSDATSRIDGSDRRSSKFASSSSPSSLGLRSYCNYACDPSISSPTLPSCTPSNDTNGAVEDCSLTACGSSQDSFPFPSKPWNQGLFPFLYPLPKTGEVVPVHGGVPQRANLTRHLEALEHQLETHIPSVNYTGNGVLDFEMWTPIWEGNDSPGYGWHWKHYQNYSLELTEKAHPDWAHDKIYNHSKAEFEEAGVRFFAATLERLICLINERAPP